MHKSSLDAIHKTIIANLFIGYIILIEIERSGFKFAEKLMVCFIISCCIAAFICLLSDDFFKRGFSLNTDELGYIDYGKIVLNRTPNETSLCILIGIGASFFMIDRYIKNNKNKQIVTVYLAIILMSSSILDLATRASTVGLLLVYIFWMIISLYKKRNRLKVLLISLSSLIFLITILMADTLLSSRFMDNKGAYDKKVFIPKDLDKNIDSDQKQNLALVNPDLPEDTDSEQTYVSKCKLKLTNKIELTQRTSSTRNLGGRLEGWEFAGMMLKNNMFLGLGSTNYQCIVLEYGIMSPQNLIIDIFIASGLVGFLAFMSPFVLVIGPIIKSQMELLQSDAMLMTCCLGVPIGINSMMMNSYLLKEWWMALVFLISYWSMTLKNNNLVDSVSDR
jgi:hypothetical protein